MTYTRKLNTVMVGTSPFVMKVVPDVKKAQCIHLQGIVSRDKEKATAFAKKFDIAKGYTVEEALKDSSIDLVYLAVPNKEHANLAIKFLQAGKHVIVEKPMAITQAEVQKILDVAKENKRFCMEALMYQCHPFIEQLLTLTKSKLGKLKYIKASYTADIFHLENKEQGGAIRNLGCYPLSLVRLLADSEPVSIKNVAGVVDEKGERDTSARVTLLFHKGLTADVATSNIGNKFHELMIEDAHGLRVECVTNPWFPEDSNTVKIMNSDGEVMDTLTFKTSQPLYAYEFDHAAMQIQQGSVSPERPAVTWEHSLGNARVIEQWFLGVVKYQQHCDYSNRNHKGAVLEVHEEPLADARGSD